ncbi:aldo/keto reductase [Haliangium ochraceum]|uniref:Aldo/keto reductase n=1 Tax=Haliangium ochraceum (strain DSM 14365 / JCM 11303 / SMP-2) TaxID=502025 RepID=D0LWH0_HALO1|nr:aldo/keto reductase [Haliangium ochraceum]ACY17620.1 aldo/keto reductase [Haliangium ochraceum DSM 14365]
MSIAARLKLGPDGPEVSRLAYGVWRLLDDPEGAGEARVLAKIDTCLEHGITTFDHADIYGGYGCEEAFGRALKARPGLRERIEIVTKCGIMLTDPARPDNRIKHYDYSSQHIIASAERSLRNLGCEHIDVLLLHRPSPLLDPAEVAEAADTLRAQGKLGALGVSNFTPAQLSALASYVDAPIVTNQVEIHPLRLDAFLDGTLDQCLERNIVPMAWSPTAGGRLFRPEDERSRRVHEVFARLSETYQAGVDQLVYAWLLRHPARIVPVLGTNQPERIAAAARALEISWDIQDWFAVWSASTGAEVP